MITALRRPHRISLALFLVVLLVACGAPAPQAPDAYLANALDWIATHAVFHDRVADWPALRAEALAMLPTPGTTAATYPAIRHVLARLSAAGDRNAMLHDPGDLGAGERTLGYNAIEADGTIVFLQPGGPAEQAGLRVGDQITQIDGVAFPEYAAQHRAVLQLTQRLTVRRPDSAAPREVTLAPATIGYEGHPSGRRITGGGPGVGYLELPWDWGSHPYATLAQAAIRAADHPPACGWILDLRRNAGGNLWTFLAAAGPILGEGDLGGFVFRDGHREGWSYRAGEVRWNGERRDESFVEGQLYTMSPTPVAILISPATMQAGETVVVAFLGRPNTRLFGEPTDGLPLLVDHTSLSDGAELFVSGARSYDRAGTVHDSQIVPDEEVRTDWTHFNDANDPVIAAAVAWLHRQPSCGA